MTKKSFVVEVNFKHIFYFIVLTWNAKGVTIAIIFFFFFSTAN